MTLRSFCTRQYLRELKTICENTSAYKSLKTGGQKSRDTVPLTFHKSILLKPTYKYTLLTLHKNTLVPCQGDY